jgi:hypothetical protein
MSLAGGVTDGGHFSPAAKARYWPAPQTPIDEADAMPKQIRWVRVLVAALLVEVGLGVTALPFLAVLSEQVVFQIIVPAACLVVPFVVAYFATRPLPAARVLHGWLIGIVATALYFGLVLGASSLEEATGSYGLPLFIVVNLLRIVSAAAGGYAAERRAQAPAA